MVWKVLWIQFGYPKTIIAPQHFTSSQFFCELLLFFDEFNLYEVDSQWFTGILCAEGHLDLLRVCTAWNHNSWGEIMGFLHQSTYKKTKNARHNLLPVLFTQTRYDLVLPRLVGILSWIGTWIFLKFPKSVFISLDLPTCLLRTVISEDQSRRRKDMRTTVYTVHKALGFPSSYSLIWLSSSVGRSEEYHEEVELPQNKLNWTVLQKVSFQNLFEVISVFLWNILIPLSTLIVNRMKRNVL